MVTEDHREQPEVKVVQGPQVLMESQEMMEDQDQWDQLDLEVITESRDILEIKGNQANLEDLAYLETMDLM